ncbi:expressed unknown protein [Seminavis robusta]|uniref:Uncharacterized protein n=1 Tax=Seminavis robusta TaxID=568900 RepID=A0A9N8HLU3_9STRA|nr:expressed unknown protein [Seminavis robusta]|eukprot:Sro853_g211160.1 n/a (328) ;mRNA; r:33333-34316
MIIIWGRTCRKSLRKDSTAVIGSGARCPRRGCNGVCLLFNVTRYCHLYFIPLCPRGEPREIVQCYICKSMFELAEYRDFQNAAAGLAARQVFQKVGSIMATENSITDLLRRSQNTEAETKARALLKEDPMNFTAMCHLNVALNGLGRTQEADKLASQIVKHWKTHCREKWITRGRPKETSSFPRVMMNKATAEYRLEAKQYFEPEKVNDETVALYKILAHPRTDLSGHEPFLAPDKRMFKLLKVGRSFVLREFGSTKDVVSYMGKQPDIRKATCDVASVLGGGEVQRCPKQQSSQKQWRWLPRKGETMAEMAPPTTAAETKSIPEVV